MRALVVTNMFPTAQRPAFGSFVRDQVEALRRLAGVDLELEVIGQDGLVSYAKAGWELGRRHRDGHFDVVHAHFGLSAWPAVRVPAPVHGVTLHGTDVSHPRSRAITLSALRQMDLVAAVSDELAGQVPRWSTRRPVRILPCGVDLSRFQRIERAQARAALGLDPAQPHLLFPAAPDRREKRHDLALELAARLDVPLLTLGTVPPDQVPLYVNAANASLVPSDREGFGLAVLEALACDVPVLATPHGVAPGALAGVGGTLCAPFSADEWAAALRPHLADPDPRVRGRPVAERYSAEAMARRVVATWEELLRARRK
jgi:glycosyltransferase involved in cell wall biosynthesis